MPRCPLNKVVNGANDDELLSTGVNGVVNEAKVVHPGMLFVWIVFYYLDKGLIFIELQVEVP